MNLRDYFFLALFFFPSLQFYHKFRSLSSALALRPNPAIMGFDNAVGNIKPDSPAGWKSFFGFFASFKNFGEKVFELFGFKTDAGVLNGNEEFIILFFQANGDSSRLGIFYRVINDVEKSLFEFFRVSRNKRPIFGPGRNFEKELFFLYLGRKLIGNFLDKLIRAYFFYFKEAFARLKLGNIKKIVDYLGQPVSGSGNFFQITDNPRFKFGFEFDDGQKKPLCDGQRRP